MQGVSAIPEITLADAPTVVRTAVATGRPAVLLGPPGVGKTQAVLGLSDVRHVLINAANSLPYDLLGQPIALQSRGSATSVLATPTWLAEIERIGRDVPGMLVIDELTTAPLESAPAFSQLLGERRCGPHRLPDGWAVVGLGNEPTHRAGARPLFAHIVNRCAVYRVVPDVGAWQA
ncbi:MAG: hypothetical protein N2544_18060, partial [Burkholderiales bacterium]|nr:hypothetical protein [Burkholderiales bacterium]